MDSSAIAGERIGGLDLVLAGTPVRLLAARAIWWPSEATLFVADVHLGKAETFRALGVPVPAGPTAATLDRLGALVDACDARRLVVLGDLLHARPAQQPATVDALRGWRAARPGLHCVLVRGNHDDRAGDPPADLGIEVVDAPSPLGPFALCHEPGDARDDDVVDPHGRRAGAWQGERRAGASQAERRADASAGERRAGGSGGERPAAPPCAVRHRLAGHQHPAVRLHGRGGDSLRLPCFRVEPRQTVLPAFGDFTGAATVSRAGAHTLYAIAGERVFEVPRAAGRG